MRSDVDRKRRVSVTVEDVISYVRTHGIVSERQVCAGLDISQTSARFKLEGAVFRGELLQDEYDAAGYKLQRPDWRYCDAH